MFLSLTLKKLSRFIIHFLFQSSNKSIPKIDGTPFTTHIEQSQAIGNVAVLICQLNLSPIDSSRSHCLVLIMGPTLNQTTIIENWFLKMGHR